MCRIGRQGSQLTENPALVLLVGNFIALIIHAAEVQKLRHIFCAEGRQLSVHILTGQVCAFHDLIAHPEAQIVRNGGVQILQLCRFPGIGGIVRLLTVHLVVGIGEEQIAGLSDNRIVTVFPHIVNHFVVVIPVIIHTLNSVCQQIYQIFIALESRDNLKATRIFNVVIGIDVCPHRQLLHAVLIARLGGRIQRGGRKGADGKHRIVHGIVENRLIDLHDVIIVAVVIFLNIAVSADHGKSEGFLVVLHIGRRSRIAILLCTAFIEASALVVAFAVGRAQFFQELLRLGHISGIEQLGQGSGNRGFHLPAVSDIIGSIVAVRHQVACDLAAVEIGKAAYIHVVIQYRIDS